MASMVRMGMTRIGWSVAACLHVGSRWEEVRSIRRRGGHLHVGSTCSLIFFSD